MKKRIIGILLLVLVSMMIIMPHAKAIETKGDNETVIGKITDDSKIVVKDKSDCVYVEMDIDNIESVKSITGYIASTTDPTYYVTVELQNTMQGTWFLFDVPSTTVIGQTYIIPFMEVVYEDGTTIKGKVTGEFQVLQPEIGRIAEAQKTVKKGETVQVAILIDNIENIKSITGSIADIKETKSYPVELKLIENGNFWFGFELPSTVIVGHTYIMPWIHVEFKDGSILEGEVEGEFKVVEPEIEDSTDKTQDVKNTMESGSLNDSDNTTSKKILPKAGKTMITGLVGVLVIFLIIIIIGSRKYKNIE